MGGRLLRTPRIGQALGILPTQKGTVWEPAASISLPLSMGMLAPALWTRGISPQCRPGPVAPPTFTLSVSTGAQCLLGFPQHKGCLLGCLPRDLWVPGWAWADPQGRQGRGLHHDWAWPIHFCLRGSRPRGSTAGTQGPNAQHGWQQAQLRPQEPSWYNGLWEWSLEGAALPFTSVGKVTNVAEGPPWARKAPSKQHHEEFLS